jgi:glycine oxidase
MVKNRGCEYTEGVMFNTAQTNVSPDVVVIGGGIIGCSVALRLAQAKAKVTLLDRGELGAEASSAAAGMLAPQGEMIEPAAFSDLCMKSRDLYPEFAAEVEDLSGEHVGYRAEGALLVGTSDEECEELEESHRVQSQRGLRLELLTGDAARSRVPGLSPEIRTALFVPGDHWVDNVRLMGAMVKACSKVGVMLRPRSEVTKLNVQDGRVQSAEVRHAGIVTTLTGGQFILAAGCWSRSLAALFGLQLDLRPCRGQMLEFETTVNLPHVVRAGMHYLVPRSSGRIVAGTTAEYVGYEKAVTAVGLRSILEGLWRIFPLVKDFRFIRAWSGFRPDTRDHLPVIGHGELKNLVFSTGHFRNGILLAPITAQLVSELALSGKTSLPTDVYAPMRLRV